MKTKSKPWQVETALLGEMWENTFRDAEDDSLVTFASRREAFLSVRELLDDVADAVRRGDMSEEYDPADYRLVNRETGSVWYLKYKKARLVCYRDPA